MRILLSLLLFCNICSLFGQSDTIAPKLIYHGTYMDYIHKNVRYPKDAAMKGIKGRVDFSFTVTPTGCIDSIKIDKSPHDLLSGAVIKVMEYTECEWIPGSINGNPVSMTLSSFINFKLE